MAELILVVVPGVGPLALAPEALRTALAKGREVLGEPAAGSAPPPADVPQLVDAAALEGRTGIPASWWMAQAREHRVPHVRIGRRVRFDPTEALACDAVRKRAAR